MKNILPFTVLLILALSNSLNAQDSTSQFKDTLLSKVIQIDRTSAMIDSTTAVLQRLDAKRKSLARNIRDLEGRRQNVGTQVTQLNDVEDSLKNSIAEYVKYKDSLEKLAAGLKKGVEELNKEKGSLKKDTATLAKAKLDVQKTIESLESQLAKSEDSLEVIAKIFKRDSIWVRGINGRDSTRVKIRQVNISIREGIMTEIIVKTDFGTFRNKTATIDILHIDERGSDVLGYVSQAYRHKRKGIFVYLDDAIEYEPVRSFLDLPYQDFDALLTSTDSVYLVKESTSVNTYFEIAGYTDIKGISGEPNGIAQFTADAKFITNTRNLRNTSILPAHFVSFVGGLSKFDNDFRGTPVYKANDSVSRKDLLQRSTYRVGAKVNLLRAFTPPNPTYLFSDFQLNAGFNFIGSKVFDTVRKGGVALDSVFRTVTQNQFYVEPKLTFDRHRNFSMTLSLPISWISLKESSGIKNFTTETWIIPSISLMYFGKRNSKSRLFFRYNHWINLQDKSQAFSQLQLGYAINLTETWGNKSN